ncbi:MAG: peptide chain release factor 1 [Anaerolineae bacterium]|nr:peptide chain release factor 1 [Anaerolineae bacterium]
MVIEKVAAIDRRYEELNELMADPAVATDPGRVAELAREASEIEPIVDEYRAWLAAQGELDGAQQMLAELPGEDELAEMARAEVERLTAEQAEREERLRVLLLPKDPADDKNVIVEVRAGTGGDEAALFAGDLFRMYARWAERHGLKTDIMSQSETGIGGFKEVIFQVKGRGAYSRLKFESGVHRVQRVPVTEAQGRIHTSTATVAVLPEADEVDVQIAPGDVRPGGQSVNTTDSAIRVTHLPTGLVVSCQDEKSQLQNRAKAMAILRARLYQIEQERLANERSEARRGQVGSGERSEKIRTYNFPQNRVTDHRIGKTTYNLVGFLDGDLDDFIEELATTDQTERLQAIGED